MNILALDLGTKCGWALCENGHIESGVQVFDVKRGESPGMRYLRFNRWLQDLAHPPGWKGGLDLIAFEQAHHRGGAATEVAAGFSTRVLELCARLGINHTSVHSATLKKFACGNGRASKEQMMSSACGQFERKIIDDNEADALFILKWAQEQA